jgi:hypothetical protein
LEPCEKLANEKIRLIRRMRIAFIAGGKFLVGMR